MFGPCLDHKKHIQHFFTGFHGPATHSVLTEDIYEAEAAVAASAAAVERLASQVRKPTVVSSVYSLGT